MKRFASALLSLGLLAAACSANDESASATNAASPATTVAPVPTTVALSSATPAAPTTAATAAATTAAPPGESSSLSEIPSDAASGAPGASGNAADAEPADRLNAEVEAWMARSGVPGLVLAVTAGGAAPTTFAWGISDIDGGTPMTAEHHVRIGSVTKPVTAAVVLQLVSEGIVELDAPVAQYLGNNWAPSYEHAAAVTVRDLLGHTSGFVEFAFDLRFFQQSADRLDQPISPEEILQFASDYGPVAELRTEYHYNTTGYVAAGLLIEELTGNTAAAELRRRVFEPLGLEHVYLTPQEFPPAPTANGYVGGTIGYLMSSVLGRGREDQVTLDDAVLLDIGAFPDDLARSAGWTGGGLEAQIGDAALLIRGLFAGGILDKQQIALMTTGHPDPSGDYGLGISTSEVLGQTVYSHGGGVPGFRTIAAYVPEFDLGIAITANLLGLNDEDDVGALLELLAPILTTMSG